MALEEKSRLHRFVIVALVNLGLGLALLIFFEGLASSLFVMKEAIFGDIVPERVHTEYDEEIGWVNLPNVYIEDMYGPGRYFQTNSQRFRNAKDFRAAVPRGKLRIICSGDSFTMGYGVDNDHAWCQLLDSLDPRIETINMGQGGYGVDQAYLWYRRNSKLFEDDVHVFAFVTSDFARTKSDRYLGYGRPYLVLRDGDLVVANEPVPKRSFYMPRATHGLKALGRLNLLRLWRSFGRRIRPASHRIDSSADPRTREIVLATFEDLAALNASKNSILVLVYLPTHSDYMGKGSEEWRKFLHEETAKHNWHFIDLIDEFRTYPPQGVDSLFRGHYSEKGNAYIADVLYRKLRAIPDVAHRLQQKGTEVGSVRGGGAEDE